MPWRNGRKPKIFTTGTRKLGLNKRKKTLRFDYYVNLCERKINPFQPKKASDTTLFGDTLLKTAT